MTSKIIIISPPKNIPSEIRIVKSLLDEGLQQFHIRKPEFSDFDMINYISSIPSAYHKFIVLHSHYHIAEKFNVKGIQVGKERLRAAMKYKNSFNYFGYSAHSFDEIIENKQIYSHFFLSPIFNSISKENYKSNFSLSDISIFLQENQDIKIIALGGMNEENCKQSKDLGFYGIALLGAIWNDDNALKSYHTIDDKYNRRNYTMSIAGFDPSSGAGITADIKTFEQHEVYGLGVITAITYQNESEFYSLDCMNFKQIAKQIEVLLSKYKIQFVKIGLIPNFEVLKQLISLLKSHDSNIKIIWDPILKSSSNFSFHNDINKANIISLLKNIYLITPNLPECKMIFGTSDYNQIQTKIKDVGMCNLLLKGGHTINDDVTDVLIEPNNIEYFHGKRLENKDKHGTGCVLSSAICSNLTNGFCLHSSIKRAKNYITQFIDSNNTLLGYHKIK